MSKLGLLANIEAKTGKEDEVEALLTGARCRWRRPRLTARRTLKARSPGR